MELSVYLAKFMGLYMLIMAAIWLFRKKQLEDSIRAIISSNGTFALTGAIHIMVGVAIAVSHSIWMFNWQGLITLLAYSSIFQGFMRLASPDSSRSSLLKILNLVPWVWIIGLLVIGIFLTYHGFKSL